MILKFHTRDHDGGWVFIDHVARIDTMGPITERCVTPAGEDVGSQHKVFRNHGDVVEWAKSYWGEDAGGDLPQHFAFVHWPVFNLGREGCGGDDDAYTLVQGTVHLDDERIGLVFLGQGEAFLLSDAGHTIDRLR